MGQFSHFQCVQWRLMAKKHRDTSSVKKRRAERAPADRRSNSPMWVVAVLGGCQDIARSEMGRRLRKSCVSLAHRRSDEIHFRYAGSTERLLDLRTVQSLFLRKDFSVQRPRTLLSPEHVNALVELVKEACSIGSNPPRHGLRLDAAGAGSPTMRRLGKTLADNASMSFAPDDGDCLLVLRPGDKGWEVLCRVGARPLATRAWRQVDYRGSLNATIAAGMIELSQPRREDRFLNLMCGGGTLLIERHLRQRAARLVGLDSSAEAIAASRVNALAAGLTPELLVADARACGLPAGLFDVIVADLPYGRIHGKREDNALLYEQTLAEAGRLCQIGGRSVFISEDVGALNRALKAERRRWDILDERTVVQRAMRPRCITLRRRS